MVKIVGSIITITLPIEGNIGIREKIETATMKIIDYGDNYKYQGPRFKRLGPDSGELFRETHLIPWLDKNKSKHIKIDFEGTVLFTPSFLEECFGGAIREGYTQLKDAEFVNIPERDSKRLARYVKEAKKPKK